MKTQHLLFCLFGVMFLTNNAYAEVNFGKQVPSADDVIKALNPSDEGSSTTPEGADSEGTVKTAKSRGFGDAMKKLNAPVKNKPKPFTGGKSPAPGATVAALSMEIIFGYNSADLTDSAKEQLKPVGQALASGKLSNLNFVIEGHTDAIGGDSYNKTLSEQRAASVKSFLVNTFNLPSTQIRIIGKGKSDLLDPHHPDSEVNRRVRIIAIK